MTITIDRLNQLNAADFTATLGALYEENPAIAAQAWHDRPFASLAALQACLAGIVNDLSEAQQLALIRAHPDLGSRVRMAAASVQEQTGAGLTQLTPAEFDRLQTLNQAYKTKFDFPYIVAVRNHTKASILADFEQRLTHTVAVERQRAIAEINQIAGFRLGDWVVAPPES